jgi:acyl carrier protein
MSTAPGSATAISERLRAEVYSVVLPRCEVGSEDDFFELGGDSLGLIRLVSLAQEAFGVRIPVRGFLAQPTLSALAGAIGAACGEAPPG